VKTAAKRAGARVPLIVFGSLVAVALLLVAFGAVAPTRWRVQQSVLVRAEASRVHAVVSDLSTWPRWALGDGSPVTFTLEPAAGSATKSTGIQWQTSGGGGHITVTREEPGRGLWFATDTSTARGGQASIVYENRAGLTDIVWTDQGSLPPIVGGLFLDFFQQQLARHMTASLAKLKVILEAPESPSTQSGTAATGSTATPAR
jgi:hypothetical protein